VIVDPATVWVDDGDTIRIRWPDSPRETVRLLGIDAPEVRHPSNPIPEDQPYGREALEYARSHILRAQRLELVRAPFGDRFRRTLGYLFTDGLNYSALLVENHLAEATVDRFGDSGFPREAAEVREAARRAGPPPFESPARFRDQWNGTAPGLVNEDGTTVPGPAASPASPPGSDPSAGSPVPPPPGLPR
jgi:endonuclease YncB( thermonuclease family)